MAADCHGSNPKQHKNSEANPRNLQGNCGVKNFSGNTRDYVAERVGFELAVRLTKFGIEISTEFPPPLASLPFGENYPPEC